VAHLSLPSGAAPEVVKHGETGLIVHSLEEMAEAVSRVHTIDPNRCREHVERNFDVPIMTDRYLAAYEFVLTHAAREKALGAAAMSTNGTTAYHTVQVDHHPRNLVISRN
jgi:hypothetical protein